MMWQDWHSRKDLRATIGPVGLYIPVASLTGSDSLQQSLFFPSNAGYLVQ